jgi:hypothetical protein
MSLTEQKLLQAGEHAHKDENNIHMKHNQHLLGAAT